MFTQEQLQFLKALIGTEEWKKLLLESSDLNECGDCDELSDYTYADLFENEQSERVLCLQEVVKNEMSFYFPEHFTA